MNEKSRFTPEEIRQKVIHTVCASLALEKDRVTDDSRLIDDLGMDSLDFLDIMFTLEKEFSAKIRDADFDRVLRPDKSEVAAGDGFLTPDEILRLTPIMPLLAADAEKRKVARKELFTYVTISTLITMVTAKLS